MDTHLTSIAKRTYVCNLWQHVQRSVEQIARTMSNDRPESCKMNGWGGCQQAWVAKWMGGCNMWCKTRVRGAVHELHCKLQTCLNGMWCGSIQKVYSVAFVLGWCGNVQVALCPDNVHLVAFGCERMHCGCKCDEKLHGAELNGRCNVASRQT